MVMQSSLWDRAAELLVYLLIAAIGAFILGLFIGLFALLFMALSSKVVALETPATDSLFPKPFTAHYAAFAKGLTVGQGRLRLQQSPDGAYEFTLTMESTGLAGLFAPRNSAEIAKGTFTSQGVKPLFFQRNQQGSRGPKRLEIVFHPQGRQLSFVADELADERQLAPSISGRIFDPLSVHLQLIYELRRANQSPLFISQQALIENTQIEAHELRELAPETVETPLGSFATRRFRQQQPGSNRYLELWLAPAHDDLLIQLVRVRRGEELFRLVLQRYE